MVECRRLLAQGLSERQIVAALRISKGTVGAIRSGKYLQPPPRPRRRRLQQAVRCGNGHLIVEVPCLQCLVMKKLSRAGQAISPHYSPPYPPKRNG